MLNYKKELAIFLTNSRSDMARDDNRLSNFLEVKFLQNSKRLDKRLKIYLADPSNEKHIHDVRTSLRRLDTFYSLLPKKLRKRNRKLIEKYKSFFRANSKIRDLDIIRKKIAVLAKETQDASKLDLQLQRRRKTELSQALRLAKALGKISSLAIKGIPSSRIEKRMNKIIERLTIRIREMLPLVLSDDTKKEELHSLRKNCKKLRYVFEVLPESHIKKYGKKLESTIGAKDLKEIQEKLGLIHDSDITMDYLQNSRQELAKQLVNKETAERNNLYIEFVKYMKE
jgi:CHAD domain-containing protein